jgi:hypothetical protein
MSDKARSVPDIREGSIDIASRSWCFCFAAESGHSGATMQCIYSRVSKASLQKTGVLLNSAGDFREFSPKKFEKGATGDFQQLEKPAIGGPFCHQGRQFSETRNAWLKREDSNSRIPDRTRSLREFSQIWEYQVCDRAPEAF